MVIAGCSALVKGIFLSLWLPAWQDDTVVHEVRKPWRTFQRPGCSQEPQDASFTLEVSLGTLDYVGETG